MISSLELRGIAAISADPVMNQFFADGKDIYTEVAYNYYHNIKKTGQNKAEIRKLHRPEMKQGVISAIYTAGE